MLRVLSDLKGYTIAGSDGEIGAVRRFFFEDEHWVVRHIVVDVGSWFSRHRVLISPAAVERIDDEQRRLIVGLTRERVRTSPDIDTDKPVSRQHETALNHHYGYTPYWGGAGPWAGGYHPYALLAPSAVPTPAPPDAPAGGGSGDPRLRSTKELSGYRLRAGDVAAGRVDDFIVDDESWAVRYLTIDTGTKPGGRRVLMPASWVREIDWSRQQVSVDGSAERVRNRPEYRPGELAVLARQTKEERVYHVPASRNMSPMWQLGARRNPRRLAISMTVLLHWLAAWHRADPMQLIRPFTWLCRGSTDSRGAGCLPRWRCA